MGTSSANKRIARNTLFLYARKILTMGIGLYTSRILLQTLGVDDFGLYGLVGSIVMLFNSIRWIFANSVQRFLNTCNKDDITAQNRIFSMGSWIHYAIALIFAIVVEIAGLIMIPELNIAPEKSSTAYWILQFSLLSAVMSILIVPYDALMMAKEKFDAIAMFSLIDSVLRLGVIFLLLLFPGGRVIWYASFIFGVSVLMFGFDFSYCRIKFKKIATVHKFKDNSLLKNMTQFAGWNFLGNLGYSLTNQALNFILNLFGGVIANAARTIAYQVNGNIRSFVVDVAMAFIPQSMMSYRDNPTRFYSLQFFATKVSSSIFLTLMFPIFLYTRQILLLWLGECPAYSVVFVHGIIFYSIVRNVHGPIDIAFKSANKMKWYQISELIIMAMNIPAAWLSLHFGSPLYSVFVVMAVAEAINLGVILFIAKREIDFDTSAFIRQLVLPIIAVLVIFSAIYFTSLKYAPSIEDLWPTLYWCAIMAVLALAICWLIIFQRQERDKILNLIRTK